jgi:TRAP-type mannitol/chloroaromatic compound transport system substrate-binding protein
MITGNINDKECILKRLRIFVMKKIYGIIIMIVATIAVMAMSASSAFAQSVIKWRLVSCWPSYSFLSQMEKRLAKNIYELSSGRLQITTYPAGELVPMQAVFDTVSKGAAEMGMDWATYWSGKNSAFDPLGSLPMALSQYDIINWYSQGGGRVIYNYIYGKYNMIYFVTGTTSCASGIRSRVPIRSLADLKGKKIRIAGKAAGYIMQKAGAVTVMTAPSEIAQALGTGAIDAAAFNTPALDLTLGLAVAKYNIGPGWNMPSSVGGVMINKDAWNALPADLKKIIEIAADESIVWMTSLAEWDNARALKEFQGIY